MAAELLRDLSRASDSNNDPLSGATWNFYAKGTLTPQAVYADAALSTSLGAIVTADAGGRFVPTYFDATKEYRGILKNAGGTTIEDIDPINEGTLSQIASTASGKGAALVGFLQAGSGAVARTAQAKLREQPVTPEDFGAAGDLVADDTAELLLFAAALGAGVDGRMDGNYLISGVIPFLDQSDFELRGTGTVTIAAGTGTGEAYSAFQFRRCTDFLVEGIEVDGNRANRTPVEASGHLVRVINCQRGTFRRVKAHNGTTDGFYIASAATGNGAGGGPLESELPADLVFEACSADGNWRNGMSIIDAYRLTVRGGTYARTTGSWDADLGPGDGIDIEPNDEPTWIQDRVRDILIEGVLFEANQGWGLQVHKNNGLHNILAKECVFRDSMRGAITTESDTEIVDCYFDGWTDDDFTAKVGAPDKRGLVDVPAGAVGRMLLIRPKYRNITATLTALNAFYSHASAPGGNEIHDPDTLDCAITLSPRAPNDRLVGGRIVDSKGVDAASVGFVIDGTFFEGCPSPSCLIQAARSSALNLRIHNPSSTTTHGQIKMLGANSKVRGCKIKVDTPAAGHGVVATVALDECVDNYVDGYTGTAFVFAAANVVQDNNNDNGTIIERDSITLTDGATITPNLALGRRFHVTLGGNRTLADPTNLRAGQAGRIRITQDGTGSRTLAYGTAWKFPGGAPTLTTTPAAVDVIEYYVHTTSLIEGTIQKAFA